MLEIMALQGENLNRDQAVGIEAEVFERLVALNQREFCRCSDGITDSP